MRLTRNFGCLLLCWIFNGLHLVGQIDFTPQIIDPLSQSWRWKQFYELEGKGIRDIHEGPDNTVWVASNHGVYAYDGYTWNLFGEEDGLAHFPIEFVQVVHSDFILAASEQHLYQLIDGRWQSIISLPTNILSYFTQLKVLENGQIAAASNLGLLLIDPSGNQKLITSKSKWDLIQADISQTIEVVWLPDQIGDGMEFEDFSDIILDNHEQYWIAITLPNEQGQLLVIDQSELQSNQITEYNLFSSDQDRRFGESQKLLRAQNGAIWCINSTYKTGISVYNNGKWNYIKLSNYFSGDEYTTDIMQTEDGTIWIASLGKLYSYAQTWKLYTAPEYPIPANRLMLNRSRGNHLWVAGYKSKVFYLDFSNESWISYKNLNFQFQDNSGDEWFIDINGSVIRKEGDSWIAFDEREGLMDAPIRLFNSSFDQIWAVGSDKGVAATAVLQDDQWEKFTHPALSWGIDYRSIFEDRNGSLWFGGSVDQEIDKGQKGGVLQLKNPLSNNKDWVHYASGENGLNQSNVYGIGQSADGRIWIGGGRLHNFDGSSWQQHPDSRLQQFVNIVTSTKEVLLAGSRYYGVFMYDGQEWTNYDNTNGLASNTIISVDIIDPECIFVATENDISRFDGSQWINHVFPDEFNLEFEGGMINHDQEGNVWINKSSRSWKRRAFTHNNAVIDQNQLFECHRYVPDNRSPETIITMFNEEVSSDGNTLIKWEGTDYFSYSDQKELLYSYKLGDQDWSAYSKDNHYTFTGLAPGKYTLQVRAQDLDLNVDMTPASIEFSVVPPVWKQTWFILLVLAFLITLGVFEYRVITKKRKLEILNSSLQNAYEKLQAKGLKIEAQNKEILQQQDQIVGQAKDLEQTNIHLEERNEKIKKQKEQLEKMVTKIEKLSKAKLSFFTNISHELRTPLTLIKGPLDQLLQEGDRISNVTRQDLLKLMNKNTDRLLKLINQLLEFRKIEASNLEIDLQSINLTQFFQNIVELFKNLAEEKAIHIEFSNLSNADYYIIDADKIEKIVVNLLSNAFKHTDSGDSILLTLDQIDSKEIPFLESTEPHLKIEVEDTGSGIPDDDLEHIYERFFSKEKAEEDSYSSGIGLAYIKELINLLKGEIRVQSELGEGSKFTIYLPFHHSESSIKKSTNTTDFPIAKKEADSLMQRLVHEQRAIIEAQDQSDLKKILIVEDNPDMQLFLISVLTDYDVLCASNGVEGLKKAKDYDIDLIISDIKMPQMDGITFCNKIKSDVATNHIPVILLTAKSMDENRIRGYEKGADGYMTKPFASEVLLARIENLLHQREVLKTTFNRDFLLTPEKVEIQSPDEELLMTIVKIMEENFEDPGFNVNQMCKMVHLSHMHFIRKVKKLTGKKPIDLLKSFRMKRAKDLLLQDKLSISEVAYKVGYDLPNSFSRTFKKEFGMSPKEFVNKEKAENV